MDDVLMTTALTRFAEDPVASDSAQFPLARPMGTPDNTDAPSPDTVRPCGLRGMAVLSATGQRITTWRYDHERQLAVDGEGIPLNETRMGRPPRTRSLRTTVAKGRRRTSHTTSRRTRLFHRHDGSHPCP